MPASLKMIETSPYVVAAPAPLRVCHIISADLWAGAEVQVAMVMGYLRARRDVTVMAVLLNEGRLATELRQLGVDVTVVDESRISSLGILAALVRFLRDRDIDIVHTHKHKDTVLGALAAKLVGVARVVRTVHGLREPLRGWQWAKYRVYEALERAILWCFADRIISVSWRLAERLRRSGYRWSAITQVHNGLDLRRVMPTRTRDEVRRELGIASDTLLIGTVGRLSAVKGHRHLLHAARLVLQAKPATRFVIVGGGPLRDELALRAMELGIHRQCLFVGPRNDVYDLIAAFDIFVLPSLDEGMPLALLEAMALAKPVVATRVGGIPEIISHRETGLLVPPRDAAALANACLHLAGDREMAQMLGAHARQAIEAEFSHEKTGNALVDVYRDVMDGAGARHVAATSPSSSRLALGLLERAWEKGCCAMERQRMERSRRHPVRLTSALRSARSILMVCHGNIIRSPFAARLVARALGEGRRVRIASCGLAAVPGRPPHATAVLTATARQVDLNGHVAAPLTHERVAASDVIFVMDVRQLLEMRRRFPEARSRTFLLTGLAPDVPLEICDPVDGDEPVFQACYDHISRAVGPILRVLAASGRTS